MQLLFAHYVGLSEGWSSSYFSKIRAEGAHGVYAEISRLATHDAGLIKLSSNGQLSGHSTSQKDAEVKPVEAKVRTVKLAELTPKGTSHNGNAPAGIVEMDAFINALKSNLEKDSSSWACMHIKDAANHVRLAANVKPLLKMSTQMLKQLFISVGDDINLAEQLRETVPDAQIIIKVENYPAKDDLRAIIEFKPSALLIHETEIDETLMTQLHRRAIKVFVLVEPDLDQEEFFEVVGDLLKLRVDAIITNQYQQAHEIIAGSAELDVDWKGLKKNSAIKPKLPEMGNIDRKKWTDRL